MEEKNETVVETTAKGWKDVRITPDMPLTAIVEFLNVLNQRLCNIEDILTITTNEGTQSTLTQIYAAQAQTEAATAEETTNEGE